MKKTQPILIAVIFLISASLFIVYKHPTLLGNNLAEKSIIDVPSSFLINPAPYPLKSGRTPAPILSAKAAIVMDADSKKVMYEKNRELRFSPASTVKIMTALVALERYSLSDLLTVQTESTIPSTMVLVEVEVISFESLLYGLLLNSGNDAALALAENYPSGTTAFVARMNGKAKKLSLTDTFFSDVSGLDDNGNFTTATDLAQLLISWRFLEKINYILNK